MLGESREIDDGEVWFGIRCVLRLAKPNIYEERITLWRTDTFEEAVALAEAEVEDYARDVGGEYLGLAVAYRLAYQPGHGSEIFSLMRDSQLDPDTYIETFVSTGFKRQGIIGDD